MHIQGDNDPDPFVPEGVICHEGNGVHKAEVIESNGHNATLEYLEDGRKITVTESEFEEIFTRV